MGGARSGPGGAGSDGRQGSGSVAEKPSPTATSGGVRGARGVGKPRGAGRRFVRLHEESEPFRQPGAGLPAVEEPAGCAQ